MEPVRRFEWHAAKAAENLRKHRVDFREACTIFEDLLTVTIPDVTHSEEEERLVTIGRSQRGRLLIVVHAERGDCIRIISARKPTARERSSYEQRIKDDLSQG